MKFENMVTGNKTTKPMFTMQDKVFLWAFFFFFFFPADKIMDQNKGFLYTLPLRQHFTISWSPEPKTKSKSQPNYIRHHDGKQTQICDCRTLAPLW